MQTTKTRHTHAPLPDCYGGLTPAEVPLYTYTAASRYLGIPASTVRWWVKGRQERGYQPVLAPDHADLLTFNDLIGLYVVKNLRRVHGISLEAIRSSIEYAERMGIEKVLLSDGLTTMSGSVFFDHLGQVVDISRSGQVALREIVEDYLVRVDRSPASGPTLHPDFRGEERVDGKFPIAVSPVVAFGQPTITGTAIKTRVVAARIDAGETVEEVAEDYGLRLELITNAVVFENAA